jgi:predicted Zn-dependent peptidase
VDPTEVKKSVTELFGGLPAREKPPAPDTAEPAPIAGSTFTVRDVHAKLPALALSWKGLPARGTTDYYTLSVLSRALVSGKSARLYQRLVKESKTCVEVDGGLGFPVHDVSDYKAPALFGLFAIYKAERKPEEITKLIMAEISKLAAEGISPAELDRVKTKLRSDWLLAQQTTLGRAQRLLLAALLDGDAEQANSLDRFLDVSSADIKAAAAKYLAPELANIFMLAPGSGR